jgi:hypothetical protein
LATLGGGGGGGGGGVGNTASGNDVGVGSYGVDGDGDGLNLTIDVAAADTLGPLPGLGGGSIVGSPRDMTAVFLLPPLQPPAGVSVGPAISNRRRSGASRDVLPRVVSTGLMAGLETLPQAAARRQTAVVAGVASPPIRLRMYPSHDGTAVGNLLAAAMADTPASPQVIVFPTFEEETSANASMNRSRSWSVNATHDARDATLSMSVSMEAFDADSAGGDGISEPCSPKKGRRPSLAWASQSPQQGGGGGSACRDCLSSDDDLAILQAAASGHAKVASPSSAAVASLCTPRLQSCVPRVLLAIRCCCCCCCCCYSCGCVGVVVGATVA